MGLKDNIDAVKKEISTEEQFLSSVIKAEGFFKKYKYLILAVVIAIVVALVANTLYKSKAEDDLIESNRAFTTLQDNPSDKDALKTLSEKNQNLYQLFLFTQEIKSGSVDGLKSLEGKITEPILKDLLLYQASSLSKSGFDRYTIKQGAILKDFARVQDAYLLLKDGKSKEALTILKQISYDSELNEVAESLRHYMK